MGTQKPAARRPPPAARRPQPATLRPPLAARHSPPATHYLPPAQAADNKIQNDRQKNTLLQRKSKYYLFVYSNRTWECPVPVQEQSLQNVIIC